MFVARRGLHFKPEGPRFALRTPNPECLLHRHRQTAAVGDTVDFMNAVKAAPATAYRTVV